MTALLIVAGMVACGEPPPPGPLEQYRNYLLPQSDEEPKNGSVKVTFLGVTTLLFDDGETQIMTDGFFSRPSLLQVARRVETDRLRSPPGVSTHQKS